MNDDYSGQTAIYGGMQGPPSWAQGLDLYEWVQVPQAYTLSSIQPMLNPAINPVYPNKPEFYYGNFGGIMSAWCGACYDDSTGDFMLPLQGGHTDYSGNEPYKVNMFAESVAWQMIRPPTGAIGNQVITDDKQESTGLYADGRLRAVHSYNYPVAGNGRMFMGGLMGFSTAGNSGKQWAVEISKITGEYNLIADYTSSSMGNNYGGACFDTKRNRIFVSGSSQSRFTSINPDTGAFSYVGTVRERFAGYPRLMYAAEIDKIVIVSPPTALTVFDAQSGLTVVDHDTGQITHPAVNGTAPPWFKWNECGAAWCGDRILLWNNNASTRNVLQLSPTGNPATDPWELTEIAGTGATPTARTANGTFGRFQYSKRLGGVMLINDVAQPFFFMRTD